MTKPVRLAREAREELHEAARRYGEVRPELRAEFLAAIDEASCAQTPARRRSRGRGPIAPLSLRT